MAHQSKGPHRSISGLRPAAGASKAWRWKYAAPELVVALGCGQGHRWLAAAGDDTAVAECPRCGQRMSSVLEGPRPRTREEGAGMAERLDRVQELYRSDLTSEEVDELAELLGRTRQETEALIADFAPSAKLA